MGALGFDDLKEPPYKNREWLESRYVGEEKSAAYIAREFGIKPDTVRYWLGKFDIPKRGYGEALRLDYKNGYRARMPKEKNPRWKGGRGRTGKYVWVWAGNSRVKLEHVAVAEKALGRPLKKNECVHHINMDGADNRPCNLLICDNSYHKWLHWRMEKLYVEEHFGDI